MGSATAKHGLLNIRRGQFVEAEARCQKAVAVFQAEENLGQYAQTRGLLATSARLKGNLAQAQTELLYILDVFKQLNDKNNMAITLNQLGQLSEAIQDWEQSLAYHQAEWELEEQMGNLHGAALAKWGIGNSYYRLGDLVKADRYYREAYDILETIGDQQNLIRLLAQRANLTGRIGEIDNAIILFEELVNAAEKLGDQLTAYDAMFNLARLFRQEGRLDEAIKTLQQAINFGEKAGLKDLEQDKRALQILLKELEEAS